jgi:hypothetical protein
MKKKIRPTQDSDWDESIMIPTGDEYVDEMMGRDGHGIYYSIASAMDSVDSGSADSGTTTYCRIEHMQNQQRYRGAHAEHRQ